MRLQRYIYLDNKKKEWNTIQIKLKTTQNASVKTINGKEIHFSTLNGDLLISQPLIHISKVKIRLELSYESPVQLGGCCIHF